MFDKKEDSMIRNRSRNVAKRSARPLPVLPLTLAVLLVVSLGASAASAAGTTTSFGFNARAVAGFPTGEVALSGGGSFDLSTDFVEAGGGFSCLSSVEQPPLAGCQAGEGVRWDTADLLSSTTFRCSLNEVPRLASTDDDTVVLRADFYRAGDGIDESFTANMIVSANDLSDDVSGIQNVWVQGVGCGTAVVHFSS